MLMATGAENIHDVRKALVPDEPQTKLQQQQEVWPFKGWYAVVVKGGREQDAADGFRRERILAYWPNFSSAVATARPNSTQGRRIRFSAVIPGLIFSPTVEAGLFWTVIERVPHVMNLVRAEEGKPAVLRNDDIQIIRLIEAGLNMPPPITPVHNYKPGDKVRFVDDKMGNWPSGKVMKLAADGRISVEVYLMRRMVPVTVLPHQIGRM